MARTDPAIRGAGGISAFVVERGTPGLSLGKPDRKMGQKGAHTCDVIFDDCRVPASQLIGGVEGVGFKTAMKVLDKGRLHRRGLRGGRRADARGCVALCSGTQAVRPADRRVPVDQAMLADSKAEAYAARCMVIDAARQRDEGRDVGTEASCAKLFASEMCGRVADRAVQIFGGAGYIGDYGIERFYRDVRLFRIYEGTTQIQQLLIARNMIRAAQGWRRSFALSPAVAQSPAGCSQALSAPLFTLSLFRPARRNRFFTPLCGTFPQAAEAVRRRDRTHDRSGLVVLALATGLFVYLLVALLRADRA